MFSGVPVVGTLGAFPWNWLPVVVSSAPLVGASAGASGAFMASPRKLSGSFDLGTADRLFTSCVHADYKPLSPATSHIPPFPHQYA